MASLPRRFPLLRKHLASVDSTNTYALNSVLAGTLSSDTITLITADEQTAGKGRLGRVWRSPPGHADITATFAFRVPAGCMPTAYQLSPLLAVTTARSLAAFDVKSEIKWPNDIILGSCRKVGGILCQLQSHAGEFWAALGIGLNVNSLPEDFGLERPSWPLTTLRAECGRKFDVDALTIRMAEEFAEAYCTFINDGFAPFQREYESRSVLLHKTVKFTSGGTTVQGLVSQVGADGMLYIDIAENGKVTRKGFLSGEVSGIELVPGSSAFVEGYEDGKA